MRHFPVFVDTRAARVLVTGSGPAATAKLRLLLRTEAVVLVLARPHGDTTEVSRWHEQGLLEWQSRPAGAADFDGLRLAYAANDDAAEDARIAALAAEAGVLCNVVDDLEASAFITPAMVDRDPVTVAIGTEGSAPVLARRIKALVEDALPTTLGAVARAAQRLRSMLAAHPAYARPGAARRALWSRFFDGAAERAIAAGEARGAAGFDAALAAFLDSQVVTTYSRPPLALVDSGSPPLAAHLPGQNDSGATAATSGAQDGSGAKASASASRNPGRVWLVGAGPGDPELLTLLARRVLREADVVMYDRLVDARVLELARREAVFEEVGKTPYLDATSLEATPPDADCSGMAVAGTRRNHAQPDITARLVAHARAGRNVVRLKSGDPMVFGRADEELDALQAAGIEWQVVPGITAAVAASAALGASLTRRGRNTEVRFATAHDTQGYAEQDWRSLARGASVTAFYMGVRAARFVQGRLLLHGAAADTPVSVVERASRPDMRVLDGQLASLDELMQSSDVRGPAVIFIGLRARASGVSASATGARVVARATPVTPQIQGVL